MRIPIGKYVVKSNRNCFMLVKEVGKDKDGNDVDDVIGYYATLESLFKAVPERALMASDATDFKTLISEFREYKSVIEVALKQ